MVFGLLLPSLCNPSLSWLAIIHICALKLKNWCFWTVVLEKTLESLLDFREIQPVHPKGVHSWIFIGRTDVQAETPILWPPDAKNWLTGKDLDAGKDWRQEDKGTTEDEMAGRHHQLDGHEFEQVPGVGDGQGSLVCCSLWGLKESDTTEWLNWLTDDLTPRTYLPFNWKFVSFDQHNLNSSTPSPWQPKRFCWEESLQTNFILKLTVIFF